MPTTTFAQTLTETKKQFEDRLAQVTSLEVLETLLAAFLGRKGIFTHLMETFKQLDLEQKRMYGPQLSELKNYCQEKIDLKRNELEQQKKETSTTFFDVTACLPTSRPGSLHVFTYLIEDLQRTFISMGFEVIDGPELETDYHNFGALNIPDDHPARESHDTFWLTLPGLLLRTHTSTTQIRTLEQQKPPLAIVSIGRVYRNEATDASHDFVFMQAEALMISPTISMADLLGAAKTFLQKIFNTQKISLRVRPGYFPFVEPGIEIDCSCPFCTNGCSVCKRTRWIELLGAGLVHPEVLRKQNIDPEKYSGFAWGMGIERLAMIKYGISDIRLFRGNNLRFLRQF